MKSLALEINLTNSCNMRCTYCFEKGSYEIPDTNDLEKLTNRIIELTESEQYKSEYSDISITFWGGEPMNKFKDLKYIYNKLKSINRISFFMYSNGYNYTEEKIQFIKESEIGIQISFDGKKIHDKYRLDIVGKSTYSNVKSTIQKLVENKIEFHLKSTIAMTDINLMADSYLDIIEMNKEFGTTFMYAPSFDSHFDGKISSNFINKLKVELLKILKSELELSYQCFSFFEKNNARMHCSAGKSMFFIDMDGAISFCHGCKYSDNYEEFKLSNIYDKDVLDFFIKQSKTDLYIGSDKCKDCISTICKICNVVNYSKSEEVGFINKWNDIPDFEICKIYKEITKYKIVYENLRK